MQRTLGDATAFVLRRALIALLVAAGYYLGAVIGTVLSVPPSGFAIIWPATALLIAVFVILPPRAWWLCVIGVVPTHFYLVAQNSDAPLIVMITQIAGNLGLAAATALALRAASKEPFRIDTFGEVLRFILIAAIAVPAIGNALILCLHLMTGWTDTFWLSWRQWMMASIFPTLVIPPALELMIRRGSINEAKAHLRQSIEFIALCFFLFACSYIVFGWRLESQWWPELPLAFFPLMLWVAARFSVGATSMALACVAAAIILRALNGQGPFAVSASAESILALQVFLTALSVPLLLLSALIQERRKFLEMLRRSEARMEVAAASTDTGLWQWDETTKHLWTTEHCRAMFGIGLEARITPDSFFNAIHPDDQTKVRAAMRQTLSPGHPEVTAEFRVPGADGAVRWFIARTHTKLDKLGAPVCVSGVFRDVTQRVNAQREAEELSERLLKLQDEERQEIAAELHDSTAQSLVAASLNLGALKRRFAVDEGALTLIEESLASIKQAANEVRTFTYLLRPAGLEGDGLCVLLQRYVEGFSRRTGLTAIVRATPHVERLHPHQQRAILRIVQESLANVHRHADATHVSITLRRMKGHTHLVIRDNGRGLPQNGQRTRTQPRLGVGIPGMIARVRQMGGRMQVRSASDGATVHASIPITFAEDPEEKTETLTGQAV
jgi:PAS domain S-box-containing protein